MLPTKIKKRIISLSFAASAFGGTFLPTVAHGCAPKPDDLDNLVSDRRPNQPAELPRDPNLAREQQPAPKHPRYMLAALGLDGLVIL
ncbi:MAG: hypothetical protein LBJ95_03955 [Oscillospiraceae bacterium]|jgi:hypothetical protein|nr:hypothetical protein [Oscillospiraceae bacterium]